MRPVNANMPAARMKGDPDVTLIDTYGLHQTLLAERPPDDQPQKARYRCTLRDPIDRSIVGEGEGVAPTPENAIRLARTRAIIDFIERRNK